MADVTLFLLTVVLILGVLWVENVSWDLGPLYGTWERDNPCGRTEKLQIGKDGTVLWQDGAGGIARGTYRVRGNRLDGPLLEVQVMEGQGSGPCSWTTGEIRPRYFQVDAHRLVFTKERAFPFKRVRP